ncbi:MAG: 23S rRNA (uracil(1939)-C(5))-methyltransferase RlmD [Rubrivivax sp.]|jgi:23S rRNA (uracil1939-C5)-methyltransferase|nr:23S rRNA (uracil(1939)-C(5))-methyltransferase RlmD [Rubrivivax sp.]
MTSAEEWLEVESLDLDGQGVAHRRAGEGAGKVVFVEGALPGERVRVQVVRRKNQWEQGAAVEIDRPSPQRVAPGCPHFGLHVGACGGCKMQHLHPAAQVAVKQRVLEDNLRHLAKVVPERMLRPIEGPAWGYRWRARLSVRHVARKGVVLVGFHERKSRYVADMTRCPVLPPRVDAMLPALRSLVGEMDARDRLPQIELAVGESASGTVIALVLRHLQPMGDADRARLRAFADEHGVQWWLQPRGPDSVHRLDDDGPELAYALPAFGLTIPFRPTDFTQVNPAINRVLVDRAVRLLDPQPRERVIDWFCGLGNFTLPLATRCHEVLGIEGSEALVQRALENAARSGLAARTSFMVRNLFDIDAGALQSLGRADRWLVDPPREGAFALVKALVDVQAQAAPDWSPPRRIVYVSCNPATLARDAGLLVHQGGWQCSAAGVVNMFPHTAHVESVAVFDRAPSCA